MFGALFPAARLLGCPLLSALPLALFAAAHVRVNPLPASTVAFAGKPGQRSQHRRFKGRQQQGRRS